MSRSVQQVNLCVKPGEYFPLNAAVWSNFPDLVQLLEWCKVPQSEYDWLWLIYSTINQTFYVWASENRVCRAVFSCSILTDTSAWLIWRQNFINHP